jgi:hypothetical protein
MALESRCLTMIAQEKRKPMPLFRMEKFENEALHLRNKLLLWRFRNYAKMKLKTQILETVDIETELGLNHVSSRIKEVMAPIYIVSDVLSKTEIAHLAYDLDEDLKSDPNFQLEMDFNRALIKIMEETEEQGDSGDSGDSPLVSPPSALTTLKAYLQPSLPSQGSHPSQEAEDLTFKIPLVKIGKKILDDENPETEDLKRLNYKLAKMIRDSLGFKIVSGHGRKRFVEVPGAYLRLVTTVTLVTSPKRKVITIAGPAMVEGCYMGFLAKLDWAILKWQMENTKQKIRKEGKHYEDHDFFMGRLGTEQPTKNDVEDFLKERGLTEKEKKHGNVLHYLNKTSKNLKKEKKAK